MISDSGDATRRGPFDLLTVTVALSLVLAIAGCAPAYEGSEAIDAVAGESLMQDTVPGLDPTPVFTSKRCTGQGSDGISGEGGMTRELATNKPLDPWLTTIADFYVQRAESDGWQDIVVVRSHDPDVEEKGIDVVTATRNVDGVPMFLEMFATIQHPGQGLYRFWMQVGVQGGTFCA